MQRWRIAAMIVMLTAAATALHAERIKDITTIKGVRSNPIQGFGLVFGLGETGDGSEITKRAVASALRKQEGLAISPDDINSKNVAAVWVTAQLPPFARKSQKIDVTINTVGSCPSLRGGTLLMTELKGADGRVYAVAQGPIMVGGLSAKGKASSIKKGHPSVGRIPSGAHVEREELAEYISNGRIDLQLRNPDFATANRIAEAINTLFPNSTIALDAGAVRVTVPKDVKDTQTVGFVEKINALEVVVDSPALVVINERTGTIIVGKHVRVSLVAITIGTVSIITEEKEQVSQPQPFSNTGTTEKVDRSKIVVTEEKRALHIITPNPTVHDLARALNAMGLSPSDLISIFEALKVKGALQAELKVM